MPYYPKPGVCDCSEAPLLEEEAILLYPSLGTPLMLAPGQNKASIFMAAPTSMRAKAKAAMPLGEAVEMYKLVDRHLRVTDLADKQEANEAEGSTKTGTLFGDGASCAAAKPHVKAWLVGRFGAGVLIADRHGRPFATIAPSAAQLYTKVQDIYEIELDFSAKPFAALRSPGAMVSLAWMIRLSAADRALDAFKGIKYAEAQDLAIVRFLNSQTLRDPWHFDKLHEFEMPQADVAFDWRKDGQGEKLQTLLKSWHPVKRMEGMSIKLGHLSDVHVNVRQHALAGSHARVLEEVPAQDAPWNRHVGSKVCNSFEALKKLFEKMAGKGVEQVDAVLLTGDLIDFNRNLNPKQVPRGAGQIGEQWKRFNLLGNIFDPAKGKALYPRGLDDMLVFSLVREMYRKYKLPIIMTSGNHEAYQVPYGISARVEAGDMSNWAFKLGVLETAADPKKLSPLTGGTVGDFLLPVHAVRAGARVYGRELPEHLTKLEAASAWTRGKANEGMSRDHNMTIYEACLAYGPTYGQALTGYNFSGDQFDWFHALFTPLADVVLAYGAKSSDKDGADTRQVIAALGWGIDENFKNLQGIAKAGVDRQGSGILPRATESFSDDQLKLLSQARRYKAANSATLTVATHFTIVSFDEPEPFSNMTKKKERTFFHPNNGATGIAGMRAALNQVNVGTCEKNQATYLAQCVQPTGKSAGTPKVDWHLSGHSHRSGVYQVGWTTQDAYGPNGWRVEVRQAKDPGIHGAQTVPPNTATALIVSSCGGPIGYQNLDGELSAWTGRPPAGTLLDPSTGEIRQIKTDRCHIEDGRGFNEKPRLCVALDYLYVMRGASEKGRIEVPLSLNCMREGFPKTISVSYSMQMAQLDCVEAVRLWVFEGGAGEYGRPKKGQWHCITPTLVKGSKPTEAVLVLAGEELVILNRAMARGALVKYPGPSKFEQGGRYRKVAQAFCEVGLRKPAGSKSPEDWAKDMQCTDPWVYPMDISISDEALTPKSCWSFSRPRGERGEVPDWDWLAANFMTQGYIEAKEVITGKKSVPVKG